MLPDNRQRVAAAVAVPTTTPLSQSEYPYLQSDGCANITDSGVGWLCTSLTKLEYLNLSRCVAMQVFVRI